MQLRNGEIAPDWAVELEGICDEEATLVVLPEGGDDAIGPSFVISRETYGLAGGSGALGHDDRGRRVCRRCDDVMLADRLRPVCASALRYAAPALTPALELAALH